MPPIPPAQLVPGTRYVIISRLLSSNPRWSGPDMGGRVFVGMHPSGTGNPGFLLERNGGVVYEVPIATRYYAIGDPDIPMPGAIPRDLWRANAPRAAQMAPIAANYPIPERAEDVAANVARANASRAAAAIANAAGREAKKAQTRAASANRSGAGSRGGRRTRVKRNNRKNRKNRRSSKRK